MARTTAQMERLGVSTVDGAFSSIGWAFREQIVADHGIDAIAEPDGLTTEPSGRYLAVQIKCGPSYFQRCTVRGWKYIGEQRHLRYWLANLMPVILVIVDADTRTGYWVQITHDAVHYTDKTWWIEIPATQILDDDAQARLRELALGTAPATADPVEQALPLLPPSAVEMLSALRPLDLDGAMRLAKFLTEGREQPRDTAETLLKASRGWPYDSTLRLATIGAYANEHGHRDLAMRAFALASARAAPEAATAERVRLAGIAAVMALSAGDREHADDLLRLAREHRGVSLLADVALSAFDADEAGRDTALEALLHAAPDEQLDDEPTCLLYLAERAFARGDLDRALTLYERSCNRFPRIVGGRLGRARVLIERMIRGASVVPHRDQRLAISLAVAVRDEMRKWAGPSEEPHRLVVQERSLAQAFAEVIELATPMDFGGQATDRESIDPTVAIAGAQASIALGDRIRAIRFADAMRGTTTEPLLRALAAEPQAPQDQKVSAWRDALAAADLSLAARISLHQVARHGALEPGDLDRFGALANLDEHDWLLFTARHTAAAGDLESAITMLRSQPSPAAGEMLAELLSDASRFDEALAVCDKIWNDYGALKGLQDKINILAGRGDLDGAEACAAQLLATGELPAEQRRQLHRRMIERRHTLQDWPGMETVCRAALRDIPDDAEYGWGLIYAHLNQDRWESAWTIYRQLHPDVYHASLVRPWADLHLRFAKGSQHHTMAIDLADRFVLDDETRNQLAKLSPSPPS